MNQDPICDLQLAWNQERPDLDPTGVGVVLRVQHLARVLGDQVAATLHSFGLEWWEYDVLSALRRQGVPFELLASELARETMVSSGAMTNRVDQLAERNLVSRHDDPRDRRRVIVRLTPTGLEAVEQATEARFDAADDALADFSAADRRALDGLLRRWLAAVA